jgi:hypothetical protein
MLAALRFFKSLPRTFRKLDRGRNPAQHVQDDRAPEEQAALSKSSTSDKIH